MRLSQRVFSVVFLGVFVIGSALSVYFVKHDFDSYIETEKENAISEHIHHVNEVVAELCGKQDEQLAGWLSDDNTDAAIHGLDGVKAIEDEEQVTTATVSGSEIMVESPIVFQNRTYAVKTIHRISKPDGKIRTIFAVSVSAISALVIALGAVFSVGSYTLPLRRVNKAIRQIAAGKYDTRLEGGKGDFSTTFNAVNDMAEAVERDVGKLSDIAENRKGFVDSMAHEMKTPLTSILCMGDLLRLKKDVSERDRRDYAGVIVEEAKRMKELSSKLLAMASTDNDSLSFEPVSTAELIDELGAAMRPVCERSGIGFSCEGIDGIISADRELFKSLIANLVDNAVKASEPAKTVGIRYAPDGGVMKIIVADQGIGMKPEDIKHATEPFYMVDKARSRKAGGAGLGLSLCAVIAKKHNATIDIKSELGKGTIVIVALPLAERSGRI